MKIASTTLSSGTLRSCLEQLQSVELLGLTLLAQSQPTTGWFPGRLSSIEPETLVQATVQLIDYGERCRDAAERLGALRAVPLELNIPEFGL